MHDPESAICSLQWQHADLSSLTGCSSIIGGICDSQEHIAADILLVTLLPVYLQAKVGLPEREPFCLMTTTTYLFQGRGEMRPGECVRECVSAAFPLKVCVKQERFTEQ